MHISEGVLSPAVLAGGAALAFMELSAGVIGAMLLGQMARHSFAASAHGGRARRLSCRLCPPAKKQVCGIGLALVPTPGDAWSGGPLLSKIAPAVHSSSG